jgi:hypothetical protein
VRPRASPARGIKDQRAKGGRPFMEDSKSAWAFDDRSG